MQVAIPSILSVNDNITTSVQIINDQKFPGLHKPTRTTLIVCHN